MSQCKRPSPAFARSTSTSTIRLLHRHRIGQSPQGPLRDVVRFISAKKNEPLWLLDWRLEAYRRWLTMQEPTWANVRHPRIDYQDLYYYSAPKSTKADEPRRCRSGAAQDLRKLGIPLKEQKCWLA